MNVLRKVFEGKQPREHTVPCSICFHQTWNRNAVCDRCQDEEGK
jgi:hypothetical protein